MQSLKLFKAVLVLLLLVLIVVILVYAKPFLAPLVFAAVLSMLLLPVTRWLEAKGFHKAVAILCSVLALVAAFAGIVALVVWQVSDLAKDAPRIEKQVTQKVEAVRSFITQSLGISQQKQEQMMQQQQASAPGKISGMIKGFLSGLGVFLFNLVLVLVYIFIFIYFRGHLRRFVLRLVPKNEEANANKIISISQGVAQKYLTGLGAMIVCLWIMYGIGFSLLGVKNALFFAILCGTLEIVPFVGNLTGTTITVLVTLAQGGSLNMIIGVVVTYALVQFIQTYLLEPLVVGHEVSINPLFTIAGIAAGEAVWGIPGMILALPVLGIVKIVFDNIEPLKPYGFLIGENKKKSDKNLPEKIKSWFK